MNAPVGLEHYLLLGAVLFVCGVVCMATKRNAIGILIGVELVLNGANINFVAFARYNPAFEIEGMVFALFVIVMAAAEAAVDLADLAEAAECATGVACSPMGCRPPLR